MAEATVVAKNLKKGNYIIADGEPCRVINVGHSKTGRHGSTKVRIEAVGIFDEKKRLILKPGAASLDVPIIQKGTAQVISVAGDVVQLMDLSDYSTFQTSIPDELKGKLQSGTEITYWKVENRVVIKEIK